MASLDPLARREFLRGDRFWTFQAIETAILVGPAAVLVAFAVYRILRRVG